jgi:ADP-ribosyl-[dinitrogen reductase] hydrolase
MVSEGSGGEYHIFSKGYEELKNKYTGCMLGAAIGDALGRQNEGVRREVILKIGYVKDYGMSPTGSYGEKLRAGQYTDDTEQMLVLAQSLIACNGFDAKDFANRIAKWGVEVRNDPARSPFIGPSSSSAIDKLNSGISWKESGSDIPSCGSAMRAAPIGLFYDSMEKVESNAVISSIPTHNSKGAIAGAVAVAVAVRCAIDGYNLSEIMRRTCERTSNHDIDLAKKIELAYESRNELPDMVFARLGTSYYVYDTVPCACYCFSRHFKEPEKAMIEAVNAGGDTDSIGCITGALCGALHGISSFPEEWITGLENKELIEQIAIRIYEKSL